MKNANRRKSYPRDTQKGYAPLEFSEIVKGMRSKEKHKAAEIVQDLIRKGVLNFKDGKTWLKE